MKRETVFGQANVHVAQVLLTHADLADRERLNNARDALGIVPANDPRVVEDLRFMDPEADVFLGVLGPETTGRARGTAMPNRLRH